MRCGASAKRVKVLFSGSVLPGLPQRQLKDFPINGRKSYHGPAALAPFVVDPRKGLGMKFAFHLLLFRRQQKICALSVGGKRSEVAPDLESLPVEMILLTDPFERKGQALKVC